MDTEIPNPGIRAAAGVPVNAQFVNVDGVMLALVREGRGPAVVCLHATGHGARDFERFSELVRDGFEVIRADWPGQGRSDADTQPASAARYAALLEGVFDALGLERAIIVGCSIGGAAAIRFAHRHPERVRGLVLCNPGGLAPVDATAAKAIALLVKFFRAGERGAGWFRPAFAAYYRFHILPSRAARAQRRRIVEGGYETAPMLRQAWASFAQPEADIRSMAAALTVPVWFAWAKGDKLVALSRSKPAIDAVPGAVLTTFRGGHAAFLERPKKFARAFRTFAAPLPE